MPVTYRTRKHATRTTTSSSCVHHQHTHDRTQTPHPPDRRSALSPRRHCNRHRRAPTRSPAASNAEPPCSCLRALHTADLRVQTYAACPQMTRRRVLRAPYQVWCSGPRTPAANSRLCDPIQEPSSPPTSSSQASAAGHLIIPPSLQLSCPSPPDGARSPAGCVSLITKLGLWG